MTVGAWAPTRACHILILGPTARKIVNFSLGVKNILGLGLMIIELKQQLLSRARSGYHKLGVICRG